MIVIRGHLGFGDCIHQRAIVRTLMEQGETVVLETFYSALYRDLRAQGLKLKSIPGIPPRVHEREKFVPDVVPIPFTAMKVRMRYNADTVHRYGSILGAQYACAGLRMPDKPNFSIPVPMEWRTLALLKLRESAMNKPIMVYRPLVLNGMFHCEQRLPDVDAYNTLFESIRKDYHVVSVANLGDHGEHIVGPEAHADTKFHHGELSGEELIGLYAEADLAFTCAGFAPVLAQAVGTRCIVVYGGHEGFKTTNIVGSHLAPTLPIETVNQCECHGGHYTRGPGGGLVKPIKTHDCDKTIEIDAALRQIYEFEAMHAYA